MFVVEVLESPGNPVMAFAFMQTGLGSLAAVTLAEPLLSDLEKV